MIDKANESHTAAAATGLRGVVVGASTVSDVVGDKGELIYQGYNIHELASRRLLKKLLSCFGTNAFLDAPSSTTEACHWRSICGPKPIIDLLREIPREADPIDVLRTAVSALEFYDPEARDISREVSLKTSIN